ncbi:hypothetical protein GCM10010833_29370 [Blastomonas aquatica]|uniref:Uncharacterized protein n=1 Tax=Blastomonas aquatica TaxID=1510276 RepID=A0ABQ1JQQ6_9SPHN|nr:hypothetical protein GCM10010833_29370 [Blastomonas aquatica]
MTSIFGMALLPLWIMGIPVIGALISLAMSAPRGNTMPYLRHADGTPATNGNQAVSANHVNTVTPGLANTPASTAPATSYPRS